MQDTQPSQCAAHPSVIRNVSSRQRRDMHVVGLERSTHGPEDDLWFSVDQIVACNTVCQAHKLVTFSKETSTSTQMLVRFSHKTLLPRARNKAPENITYARTIEIYQFIVQNDVVCWNDRPFREAVESHPQIASLSWHARVCHRVQ